MIQINGNFALGIGIFYLFLSMMIFFKIKAKQHLARGV